jgi:formate-dependent nitrite reductase membrane component NrfD
MDPKVNGQLQQEWGWLIAIYLFLGGLGGGAYTIGAINSFFGEGLALSTQVGLWIGFPALLIGSLVLLADLGSPWRFMLAGLKPGSSWMARGFWIIVLFMGFAFFHLVLHQFTDLGRTGSEIITLLAICGIVFAILTMAYTGILLGAAKGIPFWRSGVVPVFLQASYKLPDARESAQRILRKRSFVVGYILLGLATPLVLMLAMFLGMRESSVDANLGVAAVGAALGLIGGVLLRQAVLVCGALPTLNIAGFQFRRVARGKDPKAGVGLLPPS